MKLLEGRREGDPGLIEAACEALGCIEARTARKHIRFVHAAVEAKLSVLAELLAFASGPSEGPSFAPGTNPLVILCLLWEKFLKAAQELSGSLVALSLRPLLWLGAGLESWRRFNRSCIPFALPP